VQVETMSEKNEQEPRVKGPVRTCAGCGKADDADELVRIVLGPRASSKDEDTLVAVDLAGSAHGRGAHVHARKECLARAAKGGLARSFKTKIGVTAEELTSQIVDGCDRRIAGLLVGAWRAQLVGIGADAANAALDKGAQLVVVACDAGGVVDRGAIGIAIAEGRAVAWKDKQTIGALLGGRGEIAVCAITNESIAAQVASARRLAEAASGHVSARGEACRSPEAR
jgi:predicted RNA-binding protein YlxR (DUF448 family)